MSAIMLKNVKQVPSVSTGVLQQVKKPDVWWTLTIDPESQELCDEVVRRIVGPLRAQAQKWGGHQSGFTRTLKPKKPQVHLSFYAPADVVDRVLRFAQALAEECAPSVGTVNLFPSEGVIFPSKQREPAPAVVEMLSSRYGGLQGMRLQAEMAELGSEIAIWAVNRFPKDNMRSALAALMLFDNCNTMMRGPRAALWPDRRTVTWDYYWDTHLHQCTTAFGPRAEEARRTLSTRLAPKIGPAHRVMAAIAAEPSVDVWRKRWARATDMYLYRADKTRISRSAQELITMESRNLLNRFGISMRDEAALGLYARTWNPDREGPASANRVRQY